MRKHFLLMVAGAVVVCGFVPTTAVAQEPPRGEAFGGFLWTKGLTSGFNSANMFGAVGEGTVYFSDRFGLSGEVGWSTREVPTGFIRDPVTGMERITATERRSKTTLAAGPRFRFVNDSRVTPSARVMVGAWRPYSSYAFVMFFGGAVDIRAGERIAVRVQPDLMFWPDDGVVEWGFRLSSGIVVGF